MAETTIKIAKRVMLTSEHFLAMSQDESGHQFVVPSDCFTEAAESWFAQHGSDGHREVFAATVAGEDVLVCGDEVEARALLRQFERELSTWEDNAVAQGGHTT